MLVHSMLSSAYWRWGARPSAIPAPEDWFLGRRRQFYWSDVWINGRKSCGRSMLARKILHGAQVPRSGSLYDGYQWSKEPLDASKGPPGRSTTAPQSTNLKTNIKKK
jgi:hypothetical protein